MQAQSVARRAILKKPGHPDVRVEVSALQGGGGFGITVDGKSGVVWPRYTPQQCISGNTPPMTLDGEWQKLLDKYSDYTPTAVEDCVLVY
jgi:hypothetical protein